MCRPLLRLPPTPLLHQTNPENEPANTSGRGGARARRPAPSVTGTRERPRQRSSYRGRGLSRGLSRDVPGGRALSGTAGRAGVQAAGVRAAGYAVLALQRPRGEAWSLTQAHPCAFLLASRPLPRLPRAFPVCPAGNEPRWAVSGKDAHEDCPLSVCELPGGAAQTRGPSHGDAKGTSLAGRYPRLQPRAHAGSSAGCKAGSDRDRARTHAAPSWRPSRGLKTHRVTQHVASSLGLNSICRQTGYGGVCRLLQVALLPDQTPRENTSC